MSKLATIKSIIVGELGDYQEHTMKELREKVLESCIEIDKGGSALRTAIYQLKNSGLPIESRERGVYCLKVRKEFSQLEGFSILKPAGNNVKRCVYIHSDGKIILNGKLNGEIASRKIELRIANKGEKLALIVEGNEPHKFTKSGHTKNSELIKILEKKNYVFPVCYEMEKVDDIWIGSVKKSSVKKKYSKVDVV